MKMKEALTKLEQDLQRYPYEVNLCFSCSDVTFSNVLEKKFVGCFEAMGYAEVCWKRNPLTFKYVEVVRRKDQMSMLYFDAVNPNGYSKYDELNAIETYKENYEVWYDRKCNLSDEEILQRVYEDNYPWECRPEDVAEWMGIYN